MDEIDFSELLDSSSVSPIPTGIRVTYEDGAFTDFYGNFTFTSSGRISGGTVTGVRDVDTDGSIIFSVTGLNQNVLQLIQYIQANQPLQVLASLFAGNDQMIGGNFADLFFGFAGNDTLTGGGGNDRLVGGDGNDVLNGGVGADRMEGGSGSDTYTIDNAGDLVVEAADAGNDLVRSAIDYTLGANVERLLLLGRAIKGTGNALNNTITGNAYSNQLDGGVGADRLVGGAGNDAYYVDNRGDVVVELADEGNDVVFASVSYTLGADVERLTLTGSTALNGAGNALNNTITGNGGNNILNGLDGNDRLIGNGGSDTLNGGLGADTLEGGAGNDRYIVDNVADKVVELAGGGTDIVQSSVSFTLSANVESLELTGSAAISGRGNELDNNIRGNAGDNLLLGLAGTDRLYGGAGNDRLSGGAGQDLLAGEAGADTFLFDDGDFAGLGGATADRILDFSKTQGDRIDLSAVDAIPGGGDNGFAYLGTGNFTGAAGQLRSFQANGATFLSGDTDGDGVGNFLIRIDGLHTLTAGVGGDLIL